MNNVFTLCIIRRQNSVLLQRRERTPFKGYWNAPGGKVEPAESPLESCIREVFEETGLQLQKPRMRGIVTMTSGKKNSSVLVIFESADYIGEVRSSAEGELEWVDIDTLYHSENVHASFTYLLPYVVDFEGILTGKLIYSRNKLQVCDLSLQTS